MHVIESSGISTKLYTNASYISNTTDFTVPLTASEIAGLVLGSKYFKFGD